MTKILSIGMLAGTLAGIPLVVQAKTTAAPFTLSQRQQAGDTRITNRLTRLAAFDTKVQGMKNLSGTQKAAFDTDIKTDISGLTSLKAQIDGATSLSQVNGDIKEIFTNFRIYAVFLPKERLLAVSEAHTLQESTMYTASQKLETRIQDAKSKGKDVTALQTDLIDMQSKLTDAVPRYQHVVNLVTPLDPASFPGSKTTLQNARNDMQSANEDLKAAHNDAMQIRKGL